MSKLILTDADGVMLDWEGAFARWMVSQGHKYSPRASYKLHHHFSDLTSADLDRYVQEFCASDLIATLEPFLDAQKYIPLMHKKHGYVFRVITSIGSDPDTVRRREQNLRDLFGKAIESVVCLDAG